MTKGGKTKVNYGLTSLSYLFTLYLLVSLYRYRAHKHTNKWYQ